MRRFVFACLALAACAHQTANSPAHAAAAQPAAPASAPDLTPPALRLTTDVQPTRYADELTIVPTEKSFKGAATVDVTLAHPTQVIWLNANDLELGAVTLTAGGKPFTAKVLPQPKDLVGLQFDAPVPAGPASLHIEYVGKLYDKERGGISRQQLGADWYAFTHFEPIDARRAFPCFDEPSFKIPWQLTVVVPAADAAYSNSNVASTTDAGNGLKKVVFEETKPLPSYLVALAVGPIEAVAAGKTQRGTPVRILVPRGLAAEARWAAASTPEILSRLEDYFDSAYPYGKLDCIAVPQFHGGAMENVGLVTFGQELILSKPEEESISFRRVYAEVAAHELAHQWFGDLVTTGWWDDLWLNEAFATWMAPKIVEPWQPTWGEAEGRIDTRSRAMGADSLMTARRIRQPIVSDDDMQNAFDSITYQKGATVIGMFERWVGPDKFRKGVQRYMREHANGNGTAAQFLSAISAEAGVDITEAFSSFLDQAGVPLVTASIDCKGTEPQVQLNQERYLPQGSEPTLDVARQVWQIPVCARWGSGKTEGHSCELLKDAQGALPLDGAKTCPDWLLLNDGGAGYYRSLYQGDWAARLFKKGGPPLTAPERLSVVSDLSALARAGKIPYGDALALVPKLAQDPSRQVVERAADITRYLSEDQLFPEKLRSRYVHFVRSVFGKRAKALGWVAKKDDSEDTKLLRKALVPLVAREGEDAALAKEAKKLALAWVADHHSIDADIVDSVLGVAAAHGDQELFDKWHQAAVVEKDVTDRQHLLRALGSFHAPALVKLGMGLALGNEFDLRETGPLLWMPSRDPATRPVAYDFVKANFDGLVAKLPRDSGAYFPFFASDLCEPARVDDMKSFFQERSQKFTGGPRMLDQALESLKLCVAFKKAQGPSVEKFLASK
jgi:cytosol alanyl aminopeptidase